MIFQEALDYVWGLVNYETRPPETREPYTLDRFRVFLARLGNPHEGLAAVHVAGSKGKGSTAAMIEAVLRAAGYRVGFYTSPHLHDPRERIRLDGRMIPEEEFIALVERFRPIADALGNVTTFEFLTAMGFVYFVEQGVDLAVIEVGLGGRLDATNVIHPLVSVITPISLEHTQILGATIEEIAAEKGGIIKPGVPFVSAPQPPAAVEVLGRIAHERAAPWTRVGLDWTWERTGLTLDEQTFAVEEHPCGRPSGNGTSDMAHSEAVCGELPFAVPYTDLRIPLLGTHQLVNATTAIAALETLKARGFPTSVAALRRGLAAVRWPARIEILSRAPLVVVDGAHNDASAKALVETLLELRAAGLIHWRRLHLVFGIMRDKDPAAVLAPLLVGDSVGGALQVTDLALAQAHHPRALPADELEGRLLRLAFPLPPICSYPTVEAALRSILPELTADDALVVTGSLFIAAEGRAAWRSQALPAEEAVEG